MGVAIGLRPLLTTCVVLALGGFGAGAALGAGQDRPRPRPYVALVASRPVVVAGVGFRGRDRVKVEVRRVGGRVRRSVTTTSRGRFSLTFNTVRVHRCDALTIVAVGSAGRHAEMHRRAAPACGLP
jgi:hypothetical protein